MGQFRASFEVPTTTTGPGGARQVVAGMLTLWDHGTLVEDAALVVSELVTNAVEHAPGTDTVELELVAHADRLRISVADGSAVRPAIAELDHRAPRGRGMQVVAALADRWGAEEHRGGKRVWVELLATAPGSGSGAASP